MWASAGSMTDGLRTQRAYLRTRGPARLKSTIRDLSSSATKSPNMQAVLAIQLKPTKSVLFQDLSCSPITIPTRRFAERIRRLDPADTQRLLECFRAL